MGRAGRSRALAPRLLPSQPPCRPAPAELPRDPLRPCRQLRRNGFAGFSAGEQSQAAVAVCTAGLCRAPGLSPNSL